MLGSGADEILARADLAGARVLVHPGWADGMASSLAAGLAALPVGCEAAIIALGDGPSLSSEAVRRVAERIAVGDAPLVGARYSEGRAHPTAMRRSLWSRLPQTGEDGARALGVPRVDVDCCGPRCPGRCRYPCRARRSIVSDPFRVGVTRDLRAADGSVRLGPLELLERTPGVEWHFLEHDGPEVDPRDVAGVDALLVFVPRVSEASLRDADRLRVLARIGVGYDNVDLEACSRRGVLVTTTPDAVRRPLASGALALLLALAHRVVIKDRLVRAGGWQRRFEHVGEGLEGKTLGLLGFGNIARELARIARPLDLRQIAYTPRLTAADARALDVEAVSLDDLLRESDFLVVACPLNDETRGLLDADRLALMKPTASIINIARGAIIDEPALTDALREGRLAGAALDVFTQEPVDPANPLLALDQVIVAPHAVGHTDALFRAALESASRSMLEVAAGKVPAYAVNAGARAS